MGNMPVVDVGNKKVRVKRLLSEGGYAHVYKVCNRAPWRFFYQDVSPSLLLLFLFQVCRRFPPQVASMTVSVLSSPNAREACSTISLWLSA